MNLFLSNYVKCGTKWWNRVSFFGLSKKNLNKNIKMYKNHLFFTDKKTWSPSCRLTVDHFIFFLLFSAILLSDFWFSISQFCAKNLSSLIKNSAMLDVWFRAQSQCLCSRIYNFSTLNQPPNCFSKKTNDTQETIRSTK